MLLKRFKVWNAVQQSASFVKTRKFDSSMKSIMDSTNTLTDNVEQKHPKKMFWEMQHKISKFHQ